MIVTVIQWYLYIYIFIYIRIWILYIYIICLVVIIFLFVKTYHSFSCAIVIEPGVYAKMDTFSFWISTHLNRYDRLWDQTYRNAIQDTHPDFSQRKIQNFQKFAFTSFPFPFGINWTWQNFRILLFKLAFWKLIKRRDFQLRKCRPFTSTVQISHKKMVYHD